MKTEIFALRCPEAMTAEEAAQLLARLPLRQREALEALSPEQRALALRAYGLLAAALERRLGWATLPEIARSPRGKPWFPQWPGVHFSLSHTAGAVLAGISDTPLGVDLERLDRPIGPRTLRAWGGGDASDFLREWTCREALAKERDEPVARPGRPVPPLRPGEGLERRTLFDGYAAAAAWAAGERPLWTLWEYTDLTR